MSNFCEKCTWWEHLTGTEIGACTNPEINDFVNVVKEGYEDEAVIYTNQLFCCNQFEQEDEKVVTKINAK